MRLPIGKENETAEEGAPWSGGQEVDTLTRSAKEWPKIRFSPVLMI